MDDKQSPNSPGPHTPEPTIDNLLHLLDVEIENILSSQSRIGWTMWAVLGAIAGASWLLSEEVKAGQIPWDQVVVMIVAGSILLDLVRLVTNLAETQQSENEAIPRFYWSHSYFSARRLFGIVELARIVGVVLMAFRSDAFTWKFLTPFVIGYLVYFFIVALVVVMSFTRWVYVNQTNKFTYVYWALILGGLSTALAFSFSVIPPVGAETVGVYRVTALVLATIYLLLFLTTMLTTSPLLWFLMRLRRDLVLGAKSLSKAITEADGALGGLRVTDALRDDFIRIMSGIEELNQLTANQALIIPAIEQHVPIDADEEAAADLKRQLADSLNRDFHLLNNERTLKVSQVKQLIAAYANNYQRILRGLPSSYPIINQTNSYIDKAIEIADTQYNEMYDTYIQVSDKFKPSKKGVERSSDQLATGKI